MKRILIILLLGTFSFSGIAQSTEFIQLEIKIKEFINKGQWDEVLLLATDLHIADPNKGEGYYYTALAFLNLNDISKSKEYAEKAELLADESLKSKLSQLQKDIETKQTGLKIQTNAEKNQESGAKEKAVQEWIRLWEMDKSQIQYVLNAIELLVQQKKYVDALTLLKDPSWAQSQEAKALSNKINSTPEMQRLNGYNAAIALAKDLYDKRKFSEAIVQADKALGFQSNDKIALELKRNAQDEYAWQTTLASNTFTAYENYLKGSTQKKYSATAIRSIQRGLFNEGKTAASQNNIQQMEYYLLRYLREYPTGPEITDIKDVLCSTYYKQADNAVSIKTSYSQGQAAKFYEKVTEYCPDRYSLAANIAKAKKMQVRYGRPDRTYLAYVYDSKAVYGVSYGGLKNQKVGVYLTARINETYLDEKGYFTVNNAGQTDGTSYSDVRYANVSRTDYGEILLGLTKKISYPLWLYAGMGVSNKRVVWEMNTYRSNGTFLESNWAINTDQSKNSIASELGAILDIDGFHLRAGIKATDFSEFNYSVGFGFSWK